MSTLAIPPKRVRLYRVLWDRWIIVLRILFDLGAGSHPVKWRAVADTLLVDKKTAQKYIMGLVRDGHLAIAGEGYMLTETGMAFLQEIEAGEFLPLEGKNPGEKFSPLKESVVVDSELIKLTPTTPKLGKNPGENFSPLANLIIQNIPDLFAGSPLTLTGLLPWDSDEILLGWVAYAYDKRTSLLAPVGLLYSKLQRGERPPMEYARNYGSYLPDEFLRAIGLLISEPVEEDQPEPDPVPTPARELSEAEIMVQLLAENSTNVGAVCVSWSPLSFEQGILRIGVKTEAHRRAWVQRMGAEVNRLLGELTGNPQARVEFVVAVETEVE